MRCSGLRAPARLGQRPARRSWALGLLGSWALGRRAPAVQALDAGRALGRAARSAGWKRRRAGQRADGGQHRRASAPLRGGGQKGGDTTALNTRALDARVVASRPKSTSEQTRRACPSALCSRQVRRTTRPPICGSAPGFDADRCRKHLMYGGIGVQGIMPVHSVSASRSRRPTQPIDHAHSEHRTLTLRIRSDQSINDVGPPHAHALASATRHDRMRKPHTRARDGDQEGEHAQRMKQSDKAQSDVDASGRDDDPSDEGRAHRAPE